MASAAAALWAALWAPLTQLYRRGTEIWLDHGFTHLLRYLLAVAGLTYLLERKGRRFEYVQPQKYDDTVSNCAVCSPDEWAKECPRPNRHLEKAEDRVLFYGVNSEGYRLAVSVSRFHDHMAELWLALYASDGARYTLPLTLTLDRSTGSSFSAAGLRLQCLAPNRRWRVAFNGLLRKQSTAEDARSEETEVHVKFGFIWSTVSHTLEQPAELSPALLADSLAEMPTLNMLRDINKLAAEMDQYDQAGMMAGELTIADQTREVFLWGCKVRTRGTVLDGPYEEDHHFGFLEDGDTYHLAHSNAYGGRKGLLYGSIYSPSALMHPIDHGVVKNKGGPDEGNGQVFIRSDSGVFRINMKSVAPSMTFRNEDCSSQVNVAAIDLKCEEQNGSGFQISVKRREKTPHRIDDHFKHKLIDERAMKKVAPLVSDIQDQCSKVSDLTGGKGSSLAILHSISTQLNTFTVPRGFVVTTESYRRFASSGEFRNLVRKIEDSRKRNDKQMDLKEACNSVVAGIEKLEVPAEIAEEISRRVSKFNADTRFAVRSSALGEDSEDMSAAGQMTTLLGLRGQEKVISGVVKCWASQFSFTNVNYKRQYGQPLNVPMAVVVQELVDANAAGVMFTCDALTGSPAQITVTANYGLGESVVSATAEPDTFVLKRAGVSRPVVMSTQLGHKSVYTTSSDSDGVVTAPVSEEKARRACISKEEVETLAFIGTQIEKTYTTPQDIEWAISNGRFFMLQCRPVTTFFRESDCEMIHEFDNGLKCEKEVLCKANMAEVLPGATSPLSFSFIRVGIESYCKDMCVRLVRAYDPDPTQYLSLWMPLQRYNYFMWLSDGQRKTGPGSNLLDRSLMYSIMGRDVTAEVEAGVKRVRQQKKTKLPGQIFFTIKLMLFGAQGLDKAASAAAELKLSAEGMISAEQLYNYIGCNLHHMREPATLLVKAFAASSMYNLIILQVLATASGELNNEVFSELSKILLGGDVESAGVPRMIQELGSLLRDSPDKERFLNMSTEEASEWLSSAENTCGEKFREFIKKHGHRAVKEFDVYTKPWAMDPSSLVKSLKAAANAPQTGNKKELPPWDACKCAFRLSALQRLILKLVVPRARSAVAARETGKSAMVRVIHQLRLMCHELAHRMLLEGRLPSPELLFFLSYEEIGILLRTRAPELVLKAQRRQKIYEQLDKDKYPTILIGVPKPIEIIRKRVEGDFEIRGNPMSQGIAEGKARVVPTFEEAHLIEKGDILITTATDTGWTPYFPLLAGVVTEIGGPLSHGAVVAREYGLPCVVGIEGVTTMLTSGDYVQLDGNTGVLRRIAAPVAGED
ncbi:rifampicin phosphotransferase-like [Dermacentor andersoni]|uniref:rifampicin phosphotransferase-like n=1 Tax=Dermacentor andersoni TaxID=34620 RepID=UPI002155906A|nr:putative phosphoenolpyruvate synthase [Dermacentor andersoni]